MPKRRRRPIARLITALTAVGLTVLAGCAGDDQGAGTTTAALPTAGTDPTDTTTTTATTTTTVGTSPSPSVETTPDAAADTTPDTVATTEAVPSYDFSAVTPIVQSYVDEHGFEGAALVVVTKEDGIVHEEYWGSFDADRISFVASASKMVAAGVLMHLADRGLLDMDAPVSEIVDWGAANPTITPAQLVSNSSGLIGLGPAEGFQPPYACQYQVAGTLQECARSIFTTTEDDDQVVPPDTEYRYGGAQWQIAGAIAEVASGKSWAELIDEIYVQPCGLGDFAFNNQFSQFAPGGFAYPDGFDGNLSVLQPTDNPNMEAGLYTTPTDYARLLVMHLRDGRCGDVQVLSPEAIARMHADRIGPTYGGTNQIGSGYGMGWWTSADGSQISDPGVYGTYPWLELDDGFGAILVLEEEVNDGPILASQLFEPIRAALAG